MASFSEGTLRATIEFPKYDDQVPVYANQATVQFLGSEYVLTFYAAFPPMVMDQQELNSIAARVSAVIQTLKELKA